MGREFAVDLVAYGRYIAGDQAREVLGQDSGGSAGWVGCERGATAARVLLLTSWLLLLTTATAGTKPRRPLVQEEDDANVTESVTACKGLPGPMSPNAQHMETLWSVAVLAVLLITTLGLITCVVSHYKGTVRPCHPPATPTTTPMLALQAGMERDLGAQRDRQIRLHSVHTDLELDLPPSIALPDGEEIPYGSSTRLHIRDSEQESEIYQKCIRAPPNRTVFDGESPPPYRSSSAGLLSLGSSSSSSSSSSGSNDWTHSVVRCHSMSSRYPPPPHLPAVIVPTRQRLSASSTTPLTTVVPCLADPPHNKSPPRPL